MVVVVPAAHQGVRLPRSRRRLAVDAPLTTSRAGGGPSCQSYVPLRTMTWPTSALVVLWTLPSRSPPGRNREASSPVARIESRSLYSDTSPPATPRCRRTQVVDASPLSTHVRPGLGGTSATYTARHRSSLTSVYRGDAKKKKLVRGYVAGCADYQLVPTISRSRPEGRSSTRWMHRRHVPDRTR